MSLIVPVICYDYDNSFVENKLQWQKASAQDLQSFQIIVESKLKELCLPFDVLNCCNLNCKVVQHRTILNEFYNKVIDILLTSGNECISSRCKRPKFTKPGWNMFFEEPRQKSILWHKIWCDSGRPKSGTVADIMRKMRARYHLSVKHVRKHQKQIAAARMAVGLLSKNSGDLWKDFKNHKPSNHKLPNNIGKAVAGNEICDLFSYKYQSLYNRVSYNQDDLNDVVKKLDSLSNNVCSKDHCYNSHSINVSMVTSPIKLLKHNRSDGKVSGMSNFIIYSPPYFECLSLLFNSLIIHGFTPDEMLTGTMMPIPKSKHKSTHDSSNYRGIALSSIFGKIVNNIILKSNSEVFKCCDLQFGFRSNHSTSQSTFVLKEIVQYYTNNDSNVYCMLLDASKAFDHVHHIKLFKLLIENRPCYSNILVKLVHKPKIMHKMASYSLSYIQC